MFSNQHPFVQTHPFEQDDGIPEISTATTTSLSVLSDDQQSSLGNDWVVSLNSPVYQDDNIMTDEVDTPSDLFNRSTPPSLNSPVPRNNTNSYFSSHYNNNNASQNENLSFPHHNGSGSFLSLNERVNEWRLDQSQLVLRELRRFEVDDYKISNSRLPLRTSTPDSQIASWDVPPEHIKSSSSSSSSNIWSFFHTRVSEFIGLNDQVAELIAGERFVDAPPQPQTQSRDSNLTHYQQSLLTNPHWESTFISKLFADLQIPLPFWSYFMMLFRSQSASAARTIKV